jgi:hypothetical protein
MLSPKQDLICGEVAPAARIVRRQTRPRVINVDGHPAYASAIGALKQSGELGHHCNCLNRTLLKRCDRAGSSVHKEADHGEPRIPIGGRCLPNDRRFVKRLYALGLQRFGTPLHLEKVHWPPEMSTGVVDTSSNQAVVPVEWRRL